MTVKKYNRNKRRGSQPVQTKRTSKNLHNWKKRVDYAVRLLNREKWSSVKNRYT